jgi:AraC-like DNA-binding protein
LPSYLAACAPLLGDVPWLAVDSVLDARALSGASRPAHMRLSPFDLTRMRPLLAALADEVGEPAPSSRPGVRAGLLLHILGLLDRGSRTVRKTLNAANDGGDDRIITAIRYLEECYVGPISIEDLARQSGYTPTSFTRKFHQRVGLSPSDYLLNLRIQHACALLQHTSLSISSISSAVGFSDRHYFATRFRQVMGVTPSAFRVRPKTDSHTA